MVTALNIAPSQAPNAAGFIIVPQFWFGCHSIPGAARTAHTAHHLQPIEEMSSGELDLEAARFPTALQRFQ